MSSHLTTRRGTSTGGDAAARRERSNGAVVPGGGKPMLLFFYSHTSGASRKAEGFLAQVLQRRRNHDTFAVRRIDCESCRDLAARFGVRRPPTLVVVEDKRVRAKLEQLHGCAEIQNLLAPWLK